MPRTNDVDSSAAESVVFDNLDISQDDLSNDIENADADLRDEGGSDDYSDRSSSSRSRDDGDGAPSRQQRDPYPQERVGSQQRQQRDPRQQDDLGRERRVSHSVPAGAEVQADQQGNLVAPDGTIVARAGREARLYQRAANEGVQRIQRVLEQEQYKLSKAQQEHQTLNQRVTEYDSLLRTYEERDEAIKSLGLNPEHQVEAMRLFKQLTSDYPGTLKKLMTQAATRGVDVGGLAAQGIDPKALSEAISEKIEAMIKPIKERTESEQRREAEELEAAETQTQLEGEVKDFFMQNREAVPYMQTFLRVLEQPQYQNMTLGEIWARIQLSMARRGQNGQPVANGNGGNAGHRPGVPSSRSYPQAGNTEMAPISQTYESILRDVLRESGMGANRR